MKKFETYIAHTYIFRNGALRHSEKEFGTAVAAFKYLYKKIKRYAGTTDVTHTVEAPNGKELYRNRLGYDVRFADSEIEKLYDEYEGITDTAEVEKTSDNANEIATEKNYIEQLKHQKIHHAENLVAALESFDERIESGAGIKSLENAVRKIGCCVKQIEEINRNIAAHEKHIADLENEETSIDYAGIVQSAIKEAIIEGIENTSARSAWDKGVRDFAVDLFEQTAEDKTAIEILSITEKDLLDGVEDWEQFSCYGRWLAYDHNIAESLCTPSELKRTKGGELPPSSNETWLDVQAQALYQASKLVLRAIRKIK